MTDAGFAYTATPIPVAAGIGLRVPHCPELLAARPAIGWLEVHSENYFSDGGPALGYLEKARELYPLSLHGVGLSLGSADPLDFNHLQKLKRLIDRFEPGLVSEHLCWSSINGQHVPDLLPLPHTEEAIAHVVPRIAAVQDFLGRRLLIENISGYLQYRHSAMPEWEFLVSVAERADCAILLDLNNLYVSACNLGIDAAAYLRAMPAERVYEIHLAGHMVQGVGEEQVLLDSHSTRVSQAVWDLFAEATMQLGPRPTLIEWDSDLPALAVLLQEALMATRIMEQANATELA